MLFSDARRLRVPFDFAEGRGFDFLFAGVPIVLGFAAPDVGPGVGSPQNSGYERASSYIATMAASMAVTTGFM